MPRLLFEVYADGGWVVAGQLSPADPPGSISNNEADIRQVYLFGFDGADKAFVGRSVGGADSEVGDRGALRVVDTLGVEPVAELAVGEQWTMTITTDRSPAPREIRFRVVD